MNEPAISGDTESGGAWPRSSGPRGATPLRNGRIPEAEPSFSGSDLDLLTECVGLWGLYRAKVLTYDELDRSLVKLEARYGVEVELCDSCGIRRASILQYGARVCASCLNGGRVPSGDAVDRAWSDYKEWTS